MESLSPASLDFVKMQKMEQNKNYLGILGCKFEKVLSYFQHPRICQTAKFRAKLKVFKIETQNA